MGVSPYFLWVSRLYKEGKDNNIIKLRRLHHGSLDGSRTAAWCWGGMHWSQWEPVDQILNKHYFWTNDTFVKCSAQENKRKHVTHFYLLCCFSIWSLCINIEVSKDYKVDSWCAKSRETVHHSLSVNQISRYQKPVAMFVHSGCHVC